MISNPERIANDLIHDINDDEGGQVNLFLEQVWVRMALVQRAYQPSGETEKSKGRGGPRP
jgi:hypothetical protein